MSDPPSVAKASDPALNRGKKSLDNIHKSLNTTFTLYITKPNQTKNIDCDICGKYFGQIDEI